MSHQHCNFFLSSRDIRFLKKITRKRPMGQTRWPSIFSSLDVIGSHKKQTKLKYFFKLRILVFQCPGRTHITNFTRMPLELGLLHVLVKHLSQFLSLRCPKSSHCHIYGIYFRDFKRIYAKPVHLLSLSSYSDQTLVWRDISPP